MSNDDAEFEAALRASLADAEGDAELAEALRLSAAEAAGSGSAGAAPSGPASSSGGAASGAGGGRAAPRQPNARVDLMGQVVLLGASSREPGSYDLVLEDRSVIRKGRWEIDVGGAVRVRSSADGAEGAEGGAAGLPDALASIKWCTQCRATIDGRFSRNAWAWRCAPCGVDLCSACYNGPRPCLHEYAGLPPGGFGSSGPSAPPPPCHGGGRPGWKR